MLDAIRQTLDEVVQDNAETGLYRCKRNIFTDPELFPAEIKARGLNEPFATITFDFELNREAANRPEAVVVREHAKAA